MKVFLIGLLLICSTSSTGVFQYDRVKIEEKLSVEDSIKAGLPLILDITKESSETLRGMSKVTGLDTNLTSYAGFVPVRKTPESNMFFWYFPAQNGDKNAKNLIWLQGGPGGSGLFGLFNEMGPWSLDDNLNLVPRDTTWNKNYGMIFIDQPIGSGFSYTSDDSGYCNSEEEVANDLYEGISQFYSIFPDELKNELYITGESYAGKYIPAVGAKIHEENQKSATKIPLVGVSIGDGLTSPVEQYLAYSAMFYNLGLIDQKEREVVETYTQNIQKAAQKGDFHEAFMVSDEFMGGDFFKYGTYFHNCSGSGDYDNFMNDNAPASFGLYSKWAQIPSNLKAIHVGNATIQDGMKCFLHLQDDVFQSQVPNLSILMNNYRVLIYNGQLDLIVGPATTNAYIRNVSWFGQQDLKNSVKKVWRLTDSDPEVAGFVHELKTFTQVLVRAAGHIVPHDQPERGYSMIEHFIENIPYKNQPNPVTYIGWCKKASDNNICQPCSGAKDCSDTDAGSCWASKDPQCDTFCTKSSTVNSCESCNSESDCGGDFKSSLCGYNDPTCSVVSKFWCNKDSPKNACSQACLTNDECGGDANSAPWYCWGDKDARCDSEKVF